MTALLDVQGLSTVYHTDAEPVWAVRDVSFALSHGEVLGLVGESGCGKTTLAMSLLRMVKPPGRIVTGVVRLEGEDLFRRPRASMRRVRGCRMALVPQAAMNALNPVYRVQALVAEAIRAHQPVSRRAALTRARALLDSVQIAGDHAGAYPHELSGGMRQRVAIALALANEPALVIADEPVTGLDVIVQAQVLALLREKVRTLGLSMIFVSHDLRVVTGLSDRLLVMHGGEAVESGPVEQVVRAPGHPYTRRLLEATPRLLDATEPRRTPDAAGERGEPLLELRDVEKTFRARRGLLGSISVRAVDGVSLTVHPGETVGLVGESGSGKSTLARLALGLLAADRGDVVCAGQQLGGLRGQRLRSARAAMHLIHQDVYESLTPRLRVRDVVCEPMRIQRDGTNEQRAQRAIEAISQAGLRPASAFAGRFPHELSGGQRQRVALARAFVMRPRLIIADEPTSMLDAALRMELLATMRRYRDASGSGFLFITHDLALAGAFCDRIVVLLDGRVVEEGPTAGVMREPAHAYTRALLAAAQSLRLPDERAEHPTAHLSPEERE